MAKVGYTWKELLKIVTEVGEEHKERWMLWLQEAKATAILGQPELKDQPYSGPAVESWPFSASADGPARRAEILNRLKDLVDDEDEGDFRFKFWPTDFKWVNQRFGARPEVYKPLGFPGHEGVDIHAPIGKPYYAVAAGTVSKIRVSKVAEGYGTYVIVDHGGGFTTLYAHAHHAVPVDEGDRVETGQTVALSGNSGFSSAAHLHLTLQKAGHVHPEPGWDKLPGYMNPGPYVTELLLDLEPELKECFVHDTHLVNKSNSKATTKNPNPQLLLSALRDKADVDAGHIVALVPEGTLVRLLPGALENGYRKCELLAL